MNLRLVSIALAAAHHYRLMKQVVTEIRSGEAERISVEEAHMADYLVGIIARLTCRRLAKYCQERFHRGVETGDLRSYKVKFVLVRLRDMLPPSEMKDELEAEMERLVAHAEVLAGCKPDAKRRNRKAREEMAARKEAKKAAREAEKAEKAEKTEKAAKGPAAPAKSQKAARPQTVDELVSEIEGREYGREDEDAPEDDYEADRGGERYDRYDRYAWHSSYGGYGRYDSTGCNWDPDGE